MVYRVWQTPGAHHQTMLIARVPRIVRSARTRDLEVVCSIIDDGLPVARLYLLAGQPFPLLLDNRLPGCGLTS
jgi:hypothetical protein